VADRVVIPYRPRPLQLQIHALLEAVRFVVAVCHRRFGKTVMAVNHLIKAALTCTKPRGRFAYIAPTYKQGKAVAWDYLKFFAGVIPGIAIHETELRIDFPNGAQVRIFGADNPDSLRGLYFDGVVFDEYGLQPRTIFTEVVRPALADRQGWALFLGTPNGKNQFYDVAQKARLGDDPAWRFAEVKASESGYLLPAELDAAKAVMTEDEYEQEFECSFEAAVKGAFYAKELQQARDQGRITTVPYDPTLPVDTFWDLGIDAMAIWFAQSLRSGETRLIDYEEGIGEGLPYYAQRLKARGYVYGKHWGPHDIQTREIGSGRSRLETAATLGIKFETVPRGDVDEGIHAVRMILPRCYFDAKKTQAGVEALQHYRKDYNTRLQEFKGTPVHDWASHGADAFRTFAVAQQIPKEKRPSSRPSQQFGNAGWMA
jgi:hypothetical protein